LVIRFTVAAGAAGKAQAQIADPGMRQLHPHIKIAHIARRPVIVSVADTREVVVRDGHARRCDRTWMFAVVNENTLLFTPVPQVLVARTRQKICVLGGSATGDTRRWSPID
jgi:hypothetical protein